MFTLCELRKKLQKQTLLLILKSCNQLLLATHQHRKITLFSVLLFIFRLQFLLIMRIEG